MRISFSQLLLTSAVCLPSALYAQDGGASLASFKGQYSFQIEGQLLNSTQSPHGECLGSIAVDGNGNVVSGVEDCNSVTGPIASLPITGGAYTLDSTGAGTLSLITANATQTFNIYVPSAQVSTGVKQAQMVESDGRYVTTSGALAQQTSSAFTLASIAGGYSFSLDGDVYNSDGGLSDLRAGGNLTLDNGGTVSGNYTATLGGVADVMTTPFVAAALTPSTTTGRFTFTFGSMHYAGYVVDATHFDLLSLDQWTDETPVLFGAASR